MHPLEPPAQLSTPDSPICATPISRMTTPVTTRGNRRCSTRIGTSESSTSSREQSAAVPSRWPYPSGHGCRLPSTTGQVPSEYMLLITALELDSVANEVPTTERMPVPSWYPLTRGMRVICTSERIPLVMSDADTR